MRRGDETYGPTTLDSGVDWTGPAVSLPLDMETKWTHRRDYSFSPSGVYVCPTLREECPRGHGSHGPGWSGVVSLHAYGPLNPCRGVSILSVHCSGTDWGS